jgi:hypothetical protein
VDPLRYVLQDPVNFRDEQRRISHELFTAFHKVEQMYYRAEDFFIFYEQSKSVMLEAWQIWEESYNFELVALNVRRMKGRRQEEKERGARRRGEAEQDARRQEEEERYARRRGEAEPDASSQEEEELGTASQLDVELKVRHDIAREHVHDMISAFQRATSSLGGSEPVAAFREMGMQLRELLVVGRSESRVISDALVDAVRTGTISFEDARNMLEAGRVGMTLQLAPVIVRMLATGAPGRPPSFVHDAVELVRGELGRQEATAHLMSLVRQPPHSHVTARYIVQDKGFQVQLDVSGSLLPLTEEALQEIAALEREMERSRATDAYALGVASFFRACQKALTDMTFMSSRPRGLGNIEETMRRLRALRSDPELYKAWVDDMCQGAEPLPCNDTRTP